MLIVMVRSALVVEDSPTMQEIVSLILTNAGFRVTRANNGEEGLGALSGEAFDVIITDLNMPIMDGLTFVRSLRELPRFQRTPVLMLTTEKSDEKQHAGRMAGATEWLTKPLDPRKLLSVVDRVLAPAM